MTRKQECSNSRETPTLFVPANSPSKFTLFHLFQRRSRPQMFERSGVPTTLGALFMVCSSSRALTPFVPANSLQIYVISLVTKAFAPANVSYCAGAHGKTNVTQKHAREFPRNLRYFNCSEGVCARKCFIVCWRTW